MQAEEGAQTTVNIAEKTEKLKTVLRLNEIAYKTAMEELERWEHEVALFGDQETMAIARKTESWVQMEAQERQLNISECKCYWSRHGPPSSTLVTLTLKAKSGFGEGRFRFYRGFEMKIGPVQLLEIPSIPGVSEDLQAKVRTFLDGCKYGVTIQECSI